MQYFVLAYMMICNCPSAYDKGDVLRVESFLFPLLRVLPLELSRVGHGHFMLVGIDFMLIGREAWANCDPSCFFASTCCGISRTEFT